MAFSPSRMYERDIETPKGIQIPSSEKIHLQMRIVSVGLFKKILANKSLGNYLYTTISSGRSNKWIPFGLSALKRFEMRPP